MPTGRKEGVTVLTITVREALRKRETLQPHVHLNSPVVRLPKTPGGLTLSRNCSKNNSFFTDF